MLIALATLLSVILSASALSTRHPTQPTGAMKLTLGGAVLKNIVQKGAHFDATQTLDVSGILWTEHLNLVVGNKEQAQYFYLEFLGFTADAGKSFHVNLGQQQFHLADTGEPAQTITGSIGLTVPSLETVKERIHEATLELGSTTCFKVLTNEPSCLTVSCPWGNTLHVYGATDDDLSAKMSSEKKMVNLHQPTAVYGSSRMAVRGSPGIRYIEIACPASKAPAIARFYKEMMGCTVLETTVSEKPASIVCVGPGVHFLFVENDTLTSTDVEAMKGVHVCIYVQDFEQLYQRLSKRDLIWTNPRFTHLDSCETWEEARESRTLRFKTIIDLETGEPILEFEHETRALRHGQYLKVPKYEPR